MAEQPRRDHGGKFGLIACNGLERIDPSAVMRLVIFGMAYVGAAVVPLGIG